MNLLRFPASLRSLILTQRCIQTLPATRRLTIASPRSPGNEAITDDHLPSQPSSSSPALLTLQPNTLNSYSTSNPPTRTHLRYANATFTSSKHPPELLFTTAHFRNFPAYAHPEVAFLGRSNVGKSSLLNALFNRTRDTIAHVSKRPGRTRTMNAFSVGAPLGFAKGGELGSGEKLDRWRRLGPGGCVVVDMPGYGGGSQEEWGVEALKFLENRRQLRRVFLLVDAQHGLKGSDMQLLTHLKRKGVPCQVVLSKVDKLLYPSARMPSPGKLSRALWELRTRCDEVREEVEIEIGDAKMSGLGDILCCSAEKSLDEWPRRGKLGIDEIRWAILSACGLDCDEQGRRRKIDVDIVQDA